jgi:hypothetical protein
MLSRETGRRRRETRRLATGYHAAHHAVRLDPGVFELAGVILLGVADLNSPELVSQNLKVLLPDLVAPDAAQHIEHHRQAGIRAKYSDSQLR